MTAAARSTRLEYRFLVAPGAGAPCSSEWMQDCIKHLGRLAKLSCFDYPYQLAGRRAPDPQPKLIQAHRVALDEMRAKSAQPVVLVGKSMGGRIGCHLAVELGSAAPPAVVCLGYPLIGGGRMRDAVLLALKTPILFIQGTRDSMCPIDKLEGVRRQMEAKSQLYLVEDADHSLRVSAARLRATGSSQNLVFERITEAIATFLQSI